MRYYIFGTLIIAQSAVNCCDAKHDSLKADEQIIAVCVEKGGVPTTEIITDNGGHIFRKLNDCNFPCDARMAQPPSLEKK